MALQRGARTHKSHKGANGSSGVQSSGTSVRTMAEKSPGSVFKHKIVLKGEPHVGR